MSKPLKAIVTTVPFGSIDPKPVELMHKNGLEHVINPLGRKLRPEEVADVIKGFPIIIAGTEPITAKIMDASPELKAICRVGIGLDSIDLVAARQRGIAVSYTPDGPSPAVAELTIGLIIDQLRGVSRADRVIRAGNWNRIPGGRVSLSTIGIIGVGRIGGRLLNHLAGGFPGVRILANDVDPSVQESFRDFPSVKWVEKETIYREADIVSLHAPLTPETIGLVGEAELAMMKRGSFIINTARGGMIDETSLAASLSSDHLAGAAIDVFEEEPYKGPLAEIENIVLTCHMGSMTRDCRARMEIEATEEAIRFAQGKDFLSPVPESEYELADRLAGN